MLKSGGEYEHERLDLKYAIYSRQIVIAGYMKQARNTTSYRNPKPYGTLRSTFFA